MKTESANKEIIEPGNDRDLVESSNTSAPNAESFAHQLRALGQALEKFALAAFDLENVGGTYEVTGRTYVEDGKLSFSKLVRELLFARSFQRTDSASTATQVVLQFSPQDIEYFDVCGKGRRHDANKMPDPYSISQILRGVGSYIDHKNVANLVGISLKGKRVTTTYRTASQSLERVQESLEYYYEYWVKMYLERSNRPKPPDPSDPTVHVTWKGIQVG
ncbi:MAG: hypothetical protein ACM3SP_14670 [Chloroflexota bacterium]